jgi:transcriptional regulator with XRE-family HTH domain
MNFGQNIRTARRRLNLTQDQLATKLGCTKPAVSKWEANKAIPPFPRVKRLGEVLGINAETLFASIDRSNEITRAEAANMDPLLLSAWKKLSPKQRNTLVQIAILLSS